MTFIKQIYASFSVRLWLWLLLAALFSTIDVLNYWITDVPDAVMVVGICCLAVLKGTLLAALYAASKNVRWLKWLMICVLTVFSLLSALNGFCWLFYGFGITRKLLTIAAETNGAEVGEFLPELMAKCGALASTLQFWVVVGAFAALLFLLPMVKRKLLLGCCGLLSAVGLLFLCWQFATATWGKSNYLVTVRTWRCVSGVAHNMRVMRELQRVPRLLPDPATLSSSRLAQRVVVVIGESASRDHHSLYSYPLPTTPRLDSIADRLYLFTDAVASSTSTAENIPRLLSFMTDEPGVGEWYEYPTLLQIFHLLGYRTYWYSNQERTGEMSNLSGILSGDADVVEYLGCQDSEDHLTYRYDDVLLPALSESMVAPDSLQLTFLHLMGSHFQYHNRFPASRRVFTASDVREQLPRPWLNESKASLIADYDNSILFTDSVLSVAIRQLDAAPEPGILVYVADHGENVYDDRDYRGRDAAYVRVPFFVYLNRAYEEANPEVAASLRQALSRPFSTSELPQMLLHLTGTRYALYDSVRDPLSTAFNVRKRYVDGEAFNSDRRK